MTRFVLVIALFLSCLAYVADAATVRMFTVLGEIDVELDYSAPVTCANFLRYVNEGAYDNSIFHRSAKKWDGSGWSDFVLQGGGWTLAEPGAGTFVYPFTTTYDPIVNEFSPSRSNLFGTIAMAKSAHPDSATSQWFFNLGDNSESLDNPNNSGGFTVFGNVVAGVDVMLALAALDRWNFEAFYPDSGLNEVPLLDSFTNEAMPTQDDFAAIDVVMLLADADGDGVVGAADYIALKHNFGTESGATWEQGDFDGDGDVDFDDKAILEFSYGQGPIVIEAPEQSTSVPEPATLFAMLAAGLPALLKRRRRRS